MPHWYTPLQLVLILIGLEVVMRAIARAVRFPWRAWVGDLELAIERRRRSELFLPESWKPTNPPRNPR